MADDKEEQAKLETVCHSAETGGAGCHRFRSQSFWQRLVRMLRGRILGKARIVKAGESVLW